MKENPHHDENWLRLDCVALQVRKVCELFLLGSTLAHLEEGTELDPKKWHPKDAFAEIGKFNANPLPIPLKLELVVLDDGSKQFVPASKPMPLKVLTGVYGQCGSILHVPTAFKVLEEKVTPFEWDKFRGWVDGFSQLLSGHLLLLPKIHRVLICRRVAEANNPLMIQIMEGDGEAILVDDKFPDFNLISA
jgi:hypothetical protein